MKKTFLFLTLLMLVAWGNASDTIRMMQYNLMYYSDNAPEGCNTSANSLENKDTYIKNIFHYVKPDIFCVNEIGKNNVYANRLLQNALNQNGMDYFATCNTQSNSSNSISIGNRLFYDTRKFVPVETFFIPTLYSFFNGYRFYLNSPDLTHGDTVYITFIVGHLKAGNYAEARYQQIEKLMTYIDEHNLSGNIILSGDFNSAGSNEQGLAYLFNPSVYAHRFIDPINKMGDWYNNSSFANYHTQSTHSSNNEDCFSGGGLDDRFDLILVSPAVRYGNQGVMAISSSYHALGQDGEHFNNGLLSPTNHSGLPTNILQSLYYNSDHLPVVMDLTVNANKVSLHDTENPSFDIEAINPIRNDQLSFSLFAKQTGVYHARLYALDGRLLWLQSIEATAGTETSVQQHFKASAGIYFLKIEGPAGETITKKIIK